MKEKRELQRFTMELTVRISPNANGNEIVFLKTFNISSQGAFIATAEPFPVGTRLKMDIFLLSRTDPKDDIIQTAGEVVRTGATGMAVRFDEKYKILPVGCHPQH